MPGDIVGKEPDNGPEAELVAYYESLRDSDSRPTGPEIMREIRGRNRLSHRRAREIGARVTGYVSLAAEPSDYFLELAGTIGYELGLELSDAAEPEDVMRMAGALYGHFQVQEKDALTMLKRYAEPGRQLSDPELELYGIPADEVLRHLEDSILKGFWDR